MDLMKKLCCALLTMCMLISLMPASFGQDIAFTDVKQDGELGAAVNKLVQENIITGYEEDNTFRPENFISRAEFATVMSRFKKLTTGDNTVKTGFSDVDDENHWAKPYIYAAKEAGIINGFPEGVFKPEGEVTYEQAVKMVIASLGYNDLEYPNGYIAVANQKNLLTGIVHINGQSAPITRGNVALIIYRAIPKPNISGMGNIGGISFGGNDKSSNDSSKESYTVRGVITDAGGIGLYENGTALEPNQVYIEADDPNFTGVYTYTSAKGTYGELLKYLGARVKAKVEEDEDKYGKWNATSISTPENRDVSVSDSNFVKVEDNKFYYYKDEDASSVSSLTLEFDKEDCQEPAIIYNGQSVGSYDEELFKNVTDGRFRLIDNDKDGRYEVVFIDSYESYVVSKNTTATRTLSLYYDKEDIVIPKWDRYQKVEITGEITVKGTLEDDEELDALAKAIKKYDVIRLRRSLDGESVFELHVTRNSKKEAILNTINSEYMKFEGDTEKYSLAKQYKQADKQYQVEWENGNKYNLYLDSKNDIAFAERVKATAKNATYAYLLNAGIDKETGGLKLRLLKAGSQIVDIITTKPGTKLKIDGNSYEDNPEEAVEYLASSAQVLNAYKDMSRNTNAKHAQLIRYEQTGTQITAIDTILDKAGNLDKKNTEDENNFLKLNTDFICDDGVEGSNGKSRYYSSSKYFYKDSNKLEKMYTDSSTVMFFIPEDRNNVDAYFTKKFSSATSSFTTNLRYYVEGYTTKVGATTATILLQYYEELDSEFSAYSDVGIIKETPEPSLDEDSTILKMYTYSGGTASVTVSGSLAERVLAELEVGDVIRYTEKKVGTTTEMADYKYALDIDNLPVDTVSSVEDANKKRITNIHIYDTDPPTTQGKESNYRMLYGTAYLYDSSLAVSTILATDDNAEELIHNQESITDYTSLSSAKVFVYNEEESEELKLQISKLSEIQPIDELMPLSDADQVLVYSSAGKVRFVYIIRRPSFKM